MKISGTVRQIKNQAGESPTIRGATVTLIVGERELGVLQTDRLGRYEYEEESDYPGATLVCQVKAQGFHPKGDQVVLDQSIIQLDVELMPIGTNGTPPPQNWGIWAVGAVLIILVGIVLYQCCWPNGEVAPPVHWVWKPLGTSGFSDGNARNVTMVIEQGIPFVAFQDEKQDNKGTVMQYESGNWKHIGRPGLSEESLPNLSLAVDQKVPWVVYRDKSRERRVTVMKFSGTQWIPIGGNSVSKGQVSEFVSLAVYKGVPYVAYWESRPPNRAYVRRWNADKWEILGEKPIVEGTIQYLKMVLDGSQPYVAYAVGGNLDKATISIRRFLDPNWESIGPQVPEILPVKLEAPVFDFIVEKGKAYLAFSDKNLEGKLTVVMVDDKGFHFLGPLGVGVSKGAITFPSVAVVDGTVYVAFKDKGIGNKSEVRKLGKKDWDSVGQSFSQSSSSGLDLSVDRTGTVYVAFQDEDKEGKLTVMRLEKQ